MTLRGCSAVTSLRIMVLRVIIRSVMGKCSACTLFISRKTSARVGLLPAAVRHCCHCRKKKSRSVDEQTMYSQIIVPGASTFHHRACRKKESLFKTTMWLICRPRCNVLPTFVLPCLCIFGSTPTPSCPCRANSADTLFQPKTGHVLFSLANFLSPHCLR